MNNSYSSASKDMNHSMGNYISIAEKNIDSMMQLCTECSDQTGDIFHNFKRIMNKNLDENTQIGHSLFKCKTAKDIIEVSQKAFEINYKNSIKYGMDVMENIKDLVEHNIQHVSSNLDHNARKIL